MNKVEQNGKSLESWIWDAACSIRGAKDAPKFKEFILPLIFTKRLCDVFDDEINRISQEVGSRAKAFKLVKHDKKLVRFFLPLEPKNPDDTVWSIIVHELLHFSVPNHGRLWKSLMRAHLGDYEQIEAKLEKVVRSIK